MFFGMEFVSDHVARLEKTRARKKGWKGPFLYIRNLTNAAFPTQEYGFDPIHLEELSMQP
jgi:hypothetical protein